MTEADLAADRLLKERCAALLPDAAWLSEETADDAARLAADLVWVVDPIDGTRAFMGGVPDWCVCVALLSKGQPVLGVVHAPALAATYEAAAGGGARLNRAAIRTSPHADLAQARVAGPKPLVDALSRSVPVLAQARIPSLALRIARIAEGSLDAGLISPDSRDWDLAAAALVLTEAGGAITRLDGRALAYNRDRPVHPTLVASNGLLHPALLGRSAAMRGAFDQRR